jgi:arginyl-tRNA--protein-N-Asp/Glu arginylyltransferase
MELPPFIQETQTLPTAPPAVMDRLWAAGWRHFGREFFRYSLTISDEGTLQVIQPLRMEIAAFRISKSQRRVLRRNSGTEIRIVPAVVDAEREEMFFRHRERFVTNIPDSLRTFMPEEMPASVPCECVSVEVRAGGQLIAVSYLDVGETAVSSVYAMFEPDHAWRSLGTLTLLAEIEWAARQGKRWLYPGYATVQPSHYDYKKTLRPLTFFDWRGSWREL